ncbi:MAG TPA: TetR/AcrR family transcriptional regulator [Spirochaetota bacterium]|nr:TetR/AcrR family transcriptional regulator [Spirochaetota bacterium]
MLYKPPVEKRIKREKLRRTEEILIAAQKVMLAKGYNGATMDDIAAEAGLTKPTVYQYFKTKDELFVQLVEPLIQSLAIKLEAIRILLEEKKYEKGQKIISDIFDVYYSTFEENPDLFKLFNIFLQFGVIYNMNVESYTIIKLWGNKCFKEGNSIASLSVEQGFFRDTDVYHATDFVWGSFWGIVQVEQNKWGKEGISPYLKPVLKYAENLLVSAIVIR